MSQLGSLADGLCVRDPDVLAGSRPQIKKEELKHFVRQVHVDEQWIQDFLKRFRGLEEQQLNTYLTEHTSFHLEEGSMYSSAEEGEGGSSRSNTSCSMPPEHVQQQNKNRGGSSTSGRSSCSGGRSSGSRRVASLTKKLAKRGKKLDGKGEEFLYMIEKQQFKELLGIKSDKLADSLYHAFDTHGTGRINVREFLDGVIALSPLSNSDPTTKLRYAFSIYDVDGDGFVTYEELEEMLQESIKENSLQIRPENFVELVDTLFELLDKDVDGLISYEDFETTLLEHIPQAKKITLGGKGTYAEDSHRDLDLFFSESGVHFLKGSRSQGSSTVSKGSSTFSSHKPQEAEEEEYADDEEEDEYDEEESDEEHPDCEKRKQLKEKRKAGLERRRQIQSRNFEREKKREEMEELYRKMEEKFHEKREKMLRKQEELKASKEEKKRSKKWQSRKPKHEEDTSPQITDREQSYTVDEYCADFQGFLTQEGEDRKGQRTSRSGTQGMLLSSQKLLLRLTTQDNPAEEFGVIKDNDIQQFADKEQVPEWVEQLKTYSMHVEDFMPPPIARTRRAAVKRYLHVHGLQVMWLAFYAIINILLFCGWFAMFRWSDSFSLLSYGGPVARGFSVVLAFNSTLILLTVSRNVITWLRSTWLADYIPFDNNIDFHRIVAAVIVLAGVGHTGAHLWNVYAISSATNLQEIDDAINNDFDSVPEYWRVLFGSIPGATGIVIWLCIIVIYVTAQQRFRRLKFEIFWYTHHLFIIFYVALLIHGAAAMLTFPTFWIWFLFPGLTYLTERILRIARHKNDTRVIRAIHKPSRVLALEMKRPKNFQYKPGQYVFVNCPAIACHEWHPFTLTSSPLESGILSVHIRALGNWTTKIHAHFEQKEGETLMSQEEFLRRRTMRIRVDGPFGAPCENIFSYKYVMLIGAGIGITPFASVLKTIHLMLQRAHPITLEKAMLFWVNRDQRCFEWFEDLLRDVTQTREARRLIKTRTYLTGATNKNDLRSFLLWTGLEAAYLRDGIDLITGLHSRTHWGRPNWDNIFSHIKHKYPHERVGVFFCGPRPMAQVLLQMCKKYTTLLSRNRVHEELGIRGYVVKLGLIASGVNVNHPAPKAAYAGTLPNGRYDHHYAYYEGFPTVVPEPNDAINFGTHLLGTAVGSKNGIGAAPDAKFIQDLRRAGVVIVAPSGVAHLTNRCQEIDYPPGNYPYVFTVGSSALSSSSGPLSLLPGSPFGPPVINGETVATYIKPDVVSPGKDHISSVWDNSKERYLPATGTLLSAAQIAGVAALIISAAPQLKHRGREIEDILRHHRLPF